MSKPSLSAVVLLSAISAVAIPVVVPIKAVAQTTSDSAAKPGDAVAAAATEMAKPAPEMQIVLDKLAELGAKPLHTLTVEMARLQATPADAVAAVMLDKRIEPGPAAAIATRDIFIPGPAGDVKARVYTPSGEGPFPVIDMGCVS